jgi:glycosyltransferase involved in cell wall biosynthesis
MFPKGGTEIQHHFLDHYVDEELLKNFQICTSIPGKIPLDNNKVNILWQKNSYDQPNIYPWFEDKNNHKQFDWYVFNSHWNYEKFRYKFDIPTDRCHVIKNGVTNFPVLTPYKHGDMVRMLFHVTPWRGLNVLLGAMQQLQDCNVHLDVFSSCKIYGEEFEQANEAKYEPLYEQARKLENVNYIGYKEHSFIQKFMYRYHMFAYPSIWEETSCNAALEAMAAGLYCIVTNYGALYETCSEFPAYVTYDKDYKRLSTVFANAIRSSVATLHEPKVFEHLQMQQDFVKKFYSWDKKKTEWTNFLTGILNEKSRTLVHA